MNPWLLFVLVFALLPTRAHADVAAAGVFSDHMVLQRDRALPVWGTADPGESVTVTFAGQEKTAAAGKNGRWKLTLDPLTASTKPRALTITGAQGKSVTINDVLVGEIWVGSGQSNMAGAARSYAPKDETLAALLENAPYPNLRLSRSTGTGQPTWAPATREAIEPFSALLFSFGHRLHTELDVPVGLIVGAVGGTPSGSWLSAGALATDTDSQASIAKFAETYDIEKARERHQAALELWEKRKTAFEAEGKRLPRKPPPPVRPGEHTRGTEIGNLYERFIRPYVGFGIRGVLWDQGEAGTAVLGVDQDTLMGALIRGWRKEWDQDEFPFIYVQKPSGGGCAWDPANPVNREADAFVSPVPELKKNDNGLYREHHIGIREHPDTWMVTASDLGGMVHPVNKWGYGHRAAGIALHAASGHDLPVYGPSYASHEVEGRRIRIKLRDVGPGLAFKHGDALQGFVIAGEDKIFHPAEAKIDGDTVLVSSSDVPAPVAARYAWARHHPWANLFSKNGLPALTFRTDTW